MKLCVDRGSQSVWQRLNALAPQTLFYREAADTLGRYLARADFDSPFALFADLLGAGGGRKRIHTRLGPEADEAIDEFLNPDLALCLAGNTPSLQGFLQWIRSTASIVKRELGDHAADEVRIMTVHGAKGLQAPVVFLADKPQFDNRSTGLFWIEGAGTELPLWSPRKLADVALTARARAEAQQKRREESNRLLYVALTRCRGPALCLRTPWLESGIGERLARTRVGSLRAIAERGLRRRSRTGRHHRASAQKRGGSALRTNTPSRRSPPRADVRESQPADRRLRAAALVDHFRRRRARSTAAPGAVATLRAGACDLEPDRHRPGLSLQARPARAPSPGIAAESGIESWPAAAERFLSRRAHGLNAAQVCEISGEVLRILQGSGSRRTVRSRFAGRGSGRGDAL
jgi:ATP-dependent helicase/nuclease subunit A